MPINRYLIFDIGMNICEDTNFYLSKGFKVVAIEANPAMCERAIEAHQREIERGDLYVLNVAISDSRGPLRFFVCNEMSAWSTAHKGLRDYCSRTAGATFREIEVTSQTIGDVIERFGVPFYAKIDIEGLDIECLRGFAKSSVVPNYVSFEVDFLKHAEALRICHAMGYDAFSIVDQQSVPRQRQPDPPREGAFSTYQFELGCSGLFGAELPIRWDDLATTARKCRNILWRRRVAKLFRRAAELLRLKETGMRVEEQILGDVATWYDIHARKRGA
jgi:FkbM family methyltransferase